ncbi:hypothetical protein NQ318_016355 [Aromia moschata]|uniref:Uncharacterized protein n=1 Tax=Aromia moschata TaxID=1265417 RepID=A0AAV8Z3U4_9CUCU|nr:hypothetical protein NQ318_016355 [Aromia moschata]
MVFFKKTRTKETELVRYLGIKSVRLQEALNQSTQLFTAPLEADIFEPVALYSEKGGNVFSLSID